MPRRAKNHIPNPIDRHIGKRMRLQRMIRGHTTYSLAEVLGLNERTYRDYETGALRLSPYRLVQIARALCVEPGFWFVGAPSGVFEPSPPIDIGSMGDGDTRRLLRAWDAITGKPRKHLLGIALALSQLSSRTGKAIDFSTCFIRSFIPNIGTSSRAYDPPLMCARWIGHSG